MGDREGVGERMRRTCVSRYRGGRERAVRTSKMAQMLPQQALQKDHCPRFSSVCVSIKQALDTLVYMPSLFAVMARAWRRAWE